MSKEIIKKAKLVYHYDGIGIGDKVLFNRFRNEYEKGTVVGFTLRRKKWTIFNRWEKVIIVHFGAAGLYEAVDFSEVVKYDWGE